MTTSTPPATTCVICGATSHAPFKERGDYTIRRCQGCGLLALHPQPTTETLTQLYAESYYSSDASVSRGYDGYVAEADNWRLTFRDRLRFLPANGRLLDVGAAAGYFVEQARLAGWEAEGIEPSEWASRYAREALGQPVTTGMLEEAGYADACFDALTMWEVIEHIPDPQRFLLEAARVLRPGGVLALSTPDAGSLVASLAGDRWLGWHKIPEHLYFFDRAALTRMLDASGFELVQCRYVSLTVTWGFALERLATMLRQPWLARVPATIARRSVAVNPLYDLMIVARRR